MNVFGTILDSRESLSPAVIAKAAEAWQLSARPPEERLLLFDRWVKAQLAVRIDWAWAGAHKERRIEQCRIRLEGLVLDLWRRGWMLDGKRLARHIEGLLDTVGRYQRAGKVGDFWIYFGAAVDRYVGTNAEELRAEAMSAGMHVQQILGALGVQRARIAPALPDLVAQRAGEIAEAKARTLREKQSALRAARKADARQGRLL